MRYAHDYTCVIETAPTAGASLLPVFVRAMVRDPNWLAAMCDEFAALVSNRTWELMPRPPRISLISGKGVFRHKKRTDGSLDHYKVKWVVRGFRQRPSANYGKTFSPFIKPATIHAVLTIAASHPVQFINST
ncbi:uncharacterized mitochondrial protein AtMg00820-like [Aegilops tauschii subsp. strangulata]|uniref:uncharacterized mitochondrial protein AtMg00820-like n=1 Tax=Aegilops tauschii subsp. strangulata TaxID=200361 RepID=UPI003CC86D5C